MRDFNNEMRDIYSSISRIEDKISTNLDLVRGLKSKVVNLMITKCNADKETIALVLDELKQVLEYL